MKVITINSIINNNKKTEKTNHINQAAELCAEANEQSVGRISEKILLNLINLRTSTFAIMTLPIVLLKQCLWRNKQLNQNVTKRSFEVMISIQLYFAMFQKTTGINWTNFTGRTFLL